MPGYSSVSSSLTVVCSYEVCSNDALLTYPAQVTKQERIDYYVASSEQLLSIEMVSNDCIDTRTAYIEQEATFINQNGIETKLILTEEQFKADYGIKLHLG